MHLGLFFGARLSSHAFLAILCLVSVFWSSTLILVTVTVAFAFRSCLFSPVFVELLISVILLLVLITTITDSLTVITGIITVNIIVKLFTLALLFLFFV